jgi:hypothetical protein
MEIIDFDPKRAKKTCFGLCRRKKIISSKINLNLDAGNVFDLQNEFHNNRTLFEGFMEKNVWVFFGHFWARLSFDPKIFANKCPYKLKIGYFCMGNQKKMVSGGSIDPPRFQIRRSLLKSTHNKKISVSRDFKFHLSKHTIFSICLHLLVMFQKIF